MEASENVGQTGFHAPGPEKTMKSCGFRQRDLIGVLFLFGSGVQLILLIPESQSILYLVPGSYWAYPGTRSDQLVERWK